jgi:hypothetical protein
MNDGGQSAIVCGFGDVAAGLGGLAWDIGEPGAVLLSQGESQPASFAMEEGGDAATVEITTGEATLEATLAPHTAEVPLAEQDGDDPHGLRVNACAAEVHSTGGAQTLRCSGFIARWSADPVEGAGTFRLLSVERPGESFLIATGLGQPDAEGHGDERTAGWLLEGESAMPFEESLISTQYDEGGRPTRIGLELWAQEADQSSRAAATRVSGSSLGVAESGGTRAGLFRCHVDGTEGLGSYLLWRA